jgi:tetratricopeptide (TPR) repeat protein
MTSAAISPPEALRRAVEAYNNGKFSEAERLCYPIIAAKHDFFEALHLLAVIQTRLGRRNDALASYERALATRPGDAKALRNFGILLQQLERFDEALASFDKALTTNPDDVVTLNSRGLVLHSLKRFEEAVTSYDRALAIQPELTAVHRNRGDALVELTYFEEALASYEEVLATEPEDVVTLANRGAMLHLLKRFDEALASYEKAISIQPHCADAHRGEAHLRLLLGDFERGLPKFEWRWRVVERQRGFVQPSWLGKEDISRRTILLHTEQGFGDAIQFSRYASMITQTGAQVILEVRPPLKPLMVELDAPVEVLARGEPLPPFEFHCPVMSLPLALGTRVDAIPAEVPYLRAPADRLEQWNARLPKSASLRVGLVWRGSNHGRADRRPIPLERLVVLLSLPGIQFVSLQKNIGRADAEALRGHAQVIEIGNELRDFADTAAVVAQLDLVVSIDTAVAHLAGAMGKRVYILLPDPPSWRWLLDREESPWYPTARLFRQRKPGDWDHVVSRVAQAIGSLLDGRAKLPE